MEQYREVDTAVASSEQPSESREGNVRRWHATSSLSDGTPIGRLGAYWYILDDDGRAISEGYHEITLDEDGEYEGRRSTRSTRIVVEREPDRA